MPFLSIYLSFFLSLVFFSYPAEVRERVAGRKERERERRTKEKEGGKRRGDEIIMVRRRGKVCAVYCSRASTSVVTHEPYTYQSYKNAKERMVYRNECITVKRKEGRKKKYRYLNTLQG